MGFEKVELTEANSQNTTAPPTDMVLAGDLISMNTPNTPNAPQLVTYVPVGQFYR